MFKQFCLKFLAVGIALAPILPGYANAAPARSNPVVVRFVFVDNDGVSRMFLRLRDGSYIDASRALAATETRLAAGDAVAAARDAKVAAADARYARSQNNRVAFMRR